MQESDREDGDINDRAGYLLDPTKIKRVNKHMADRITTRNGRYPGEDEKFCKDHNGRKIPGRYNVRGYFKVTDDQLRARLLQLGQVDAQGFLLDQNGDRIHNEEIGKRVKMRREEKTQELMFPSEEEQYSYDPEGR